MPFILPLLGDLVFGLVVVLFAIAGYVVVRALQATVSRTFPVVGGWIAEAIGGASSLIQGWFVATNRAVFGRVAAVIRAWPYIAGELGYWIVQAFNHQGDQIAHHNNVSIPNARNDAISASHGYTDTVHTITDARIDGVVSDIAGTAENLQHNIDGLSNYVNGPFHADVYNAIAAAGTAAETEARLELQRAEADLVARIAGDETIVSNLNEVATVALPAAIAAGVQSAKDAAHAELVGQVQALTSRLDDLQRQIAQAASDEQMALSQVTQAIAAQRAADLTTEQGRIDAAAAATLATAQMGIAAEAAQRAAALDAQSKAVAVQLDTINATETITQANIGTLENVTSVVIPASIAAVAAGVASITAEFERCAVTACEGPNNWQQLFQAAYGLAAGAEVAEFLANAIKDPTGEAASLASVASGVYNDGHALLDSLLSL